MYQAKQYTLFAMPVSEKPVIAEKQPTMFSKLLKLARASRKMASRPLNENALRYEACGQFIKGEPVNPQTV